MGGNSEYKGFYICKKVKGLCRMLMFFFFISVLAGKNLVMETV